MQFMWHVWVNIRHTQLIVLLWFLEKMGNGTGGRVRGRAVPGAEGAVGQGTEPRPPGPARNGQGRIQGLHGRGRNRKSFGGVSN